MEEEVIFEGIEGLFATESLETKIAMAIEEGIDMGISEVSQEQITAQLTAKALAHMENTAAGFQQLQGFTYHYGTDLNSLQRKLTEDESYLIRLIDKWSKLLPRAYFGVDVFGVLNPQRDIFEKEIKVPFSTTYYPRGNFKDMESTFYKTAKDRFWKGFIEFPLNDYRGNLINKIDDLNFYRITSMMWLVKTQYVLGIRDDVDDFYKNDKTHFFNPLVYNSRVHNDIWDEQKKYGHKDTDVSTYYSYINRWRCWLEVYSIFSTDDTLFLPVSLEEQKILFEKHIGEKTKQTYINFLDWYAPVLWDFINNPNDKYGTLENDLKEMTRLSNLTTAEKIITSGEDIGRTPEWDRLQKSFQNISKEFLELGEYFENRKESTNQVRSYDGYRDADAYAYDLDVSNNKTLYPFSNKLLRWSLDKEKELKTDLQYYKDIKEQEFEKQIFDEEQKEKKEAEKKEEEDERLSKIAASNKAIQEKYTQERIDFDKEIEEENIRERERRKELLESLEEEPLVEEQLLEKVVTKPEKYFYNVGDNINWDGIPYFVVERKIENDKPYYRLNSNEDTDFDMWMSKEQFNPEEIDELELFEFEEKEYLYLLKIKSLL